MRCYLTHEPVVVRPASAAYRSGKFVKRHKLALAVAAVFAMVAVCTRLSRCRIRERSAQNWCDGRNEACNKLTECSYCSHWESDTSAFRPGIFFTWRALTRHTSKPRYTRIWKSGTQNTPANLIATVLIRLRCSQSASRCRSSVKVWKERTACGLRSTGAAI
jgi:hypothetical protein